MSQILKQEQSDSSTLLKFFLNISDKGMGHYRTFVIENNETFGNLKKRVLNKIAVSQKDSPFYSFVLKFLSDTSLTRCSLKLHDNEIISEVLERENICYKGEYAVIFSDIRCEKTSKHTANSDQDQEKVLNSDFYRSQSSKTFDSVAGTEFLYGAARKSKSSITETLLAEVQNICLKSGKLFKKLSEGRDQWRYLL
jgi:hypothetical protein